MLKESENTPKAEKSAPSKKTKCLSWKEIVKRIPATATYYLAFITLGYYYSVSGPTLSLLSDYLNVSESQVGLLITFRGLGLIPASVVCGFIFKWVQRYNTIDNNRFSSPKTGWKYFFQFLLFKAKRFFIPTINKILIYSLYGVSITLILTPFIPYFPVTCVLFFFQGFFTSFIEVGCIVCFSNIWGEFIDPIMQGCICVFLLGCFVFPLIIAQLFTYVEDPHTQLTTAYLVCSVMAYFPAVLLLTVVDTPGDIQQDNSGDDDDADDESAKKKKEEQRRMMSMSEKVKRLVSELFSLKNLILLLVGIMKLLGVGAQIGFLNLAFLFGDRKNLDSEANLSYLMSIAYIVAVVTAGVVSFISIVLSPIVIVFASFSLSSILFLFWIIFVDSRFMLWFGTIAYALIGAPINAVLLSLPLVHYNIPINEFTGSFITFFQYIGEMSLPTLMSFLSDDKALGPNGNIYVTFVANVVTFGVLLTTIAIGCIYMRRKKRKKGGKHEADLSVSVSSKTTSSEAKGIDGTLVGVEKEGNENVNDTKNEEKEKDEVEAEEQGESGKHVEHQTEILD